MNVRELIDTVEGKLDLLASQQTQEDRNLLRKEIKDHLDDVRDVLGLPQDVLCGGGCGVDLGEEPETITLPYPTSYQRLSLAVQRAYHDLRGRGYECYADLLCCQTCGLSAIEGDKYVFWHLQDADAAEREGTLMLCWGGDGDEIVEAMRSAGLDAEWDGSQGRRIAVRRRDEEKEVAA